MRNVRLLLLNVYESFWLTIQGILEFLFNIFEFVVFGLIRSFRDYQTLWVVLVLGLIVTSIAF